MTTKGILLTIYILAYLFCGMLIVMLFVHKPYVAYIMGAVLMALLIFSSTVIFKR